MAVIKEHLSIKVKGFVQGLGFRPFVYRLAKQYQQFGWVLNTNEGISISIEGCSFQQQKFLTDLQQSLPALAKIDSLVSNKKPLKKFDSFVIKSSLTADKNSTFILPDISPCTECVADIFNPKSRFYRYPFTSCCYCGPRYSIMQQQPYDRIRTAMAGFSVCEGCMAEYGNAENRRFHSQTIACKACGPQLNLLDKQGDSVEKGNQALNQAVEYLKQGEIVAIKGVGGFQLLVDATNYRAVETLRIRKQRAEKPFALLVKNLERAKNLCQISDVEAQALMSYESPIVLLRRLSNRYVVDTVAPGNKLLGIMLPCSPLHHLLANDFDKPLVATSGNRNGEPLCITEEQALVRLKGIADFFLTHDRDIIRPLDDSIVRVINNKPVLIRRARGYTPMPITISQILPEQLAVGGQMKNTLAISQGNQLILSQHMGDLESLSSQNQFQQTITDFQAIYASKPDKVIHDLHPDYHSTMVANQQEVKTRAVQHHHAHILSCMAEHDITAPVLGFAWDGAGLGLDNTIWGGECFLLTEQHFQRYAHLRTFPLLGADKAASEPRRSALGLLYEMDVNDLFKHKDSDALASFSEQQLKLLQQSLTKQLNTPLTSSVGRLFDAVSSLLDLCHINSYEGQAAMLLEQAASTIKTDERYPYQLLKQQVIVIDWQTIIMGILADLPKLSKALIAAKFHNTLVDIIVTIAKIAQQQNIVLSGGCFQNAYLAEKSIKQLESAGFTVYTHEKIPMNDGGLALGQLYCSAIME